MISIPKRYCEPSIFLLFIFAFFISFEIAAASDTLITRYGRLDAVPIANLPENDQFKDYENDSEVVLFNSKIVFSDALHPLTFVRKIESGNRDYVIILEEEKSNHKPIEYIISTGPDGFSKDFHEGFVAGTLGRHRILGYSGIAFKLTDGGEIIIQNDAVASRGR